MPEVLVNSKKTSERRIGGIGLALGAALAVAAIGAEGARAARPPLPLTWPPVTPHATNDYFAERTRISGTHYDVVVPLEGVGEEPGEPQRWVPGSQSLWWEYTAPSDGRLRVEAGTATTRAAVVIYQGVRLSELYTVASGWAPRVLPVQRGEVYQIAIVCSAGLDPTVHVIIDLQGQPENDNFGNAFRLEGTNATASASLLDATREAGEPSHVATVSSGQTVWWVWEAPATGRVVLAHSDALLNFGVGVYTGAALSDLKRVWCNTSPYATIFHARAGTAYHLVFEGIQGGNPDFQFTLASETLQPATNDDFADAPLLTGPYPEARSSTLGASREPGEPAHGGDGARRSIWWRWQAPYNTRARIGNYYGSIPDVAWGVYTGEAVGALTLVSRGDRLFNVVGGQMYSIAAETAWDNVGDIFVEVYALPSEGWHYDLPGNLVQNPSFEDPGDFLTSWSSTGEVGQEGGVHPWLGFPAYGDGQTRAALAAGSRLWQGVPTAAGGSYRVQLGVCAQGLDIPVSLRICFGSDEPAAVSFTPVFPDVLWRWPVFEFTAAATSTTLSIENTGALASIDQVSVVSLGTAPAITMHPRSATAYEGTRLTLTADATGSEPLFRQWFFNGQPIPGLSDRYLTLFPLMTNYAGSYCFVAANAYGAATSQVATVTVERPAGPIIVLQPSGDAVSEGLYFALTVAARGPRPLRYQWYFGEQPINNATNRSLVFAPISRDDAGAYRVRVFDGTESVLSLPAQVRVRPALPSTWFVNFSNSEPVWAPVYDTDGISALDGDAFLAQLYAGPTPELLRPVGRPRPFMMPGLIYPDVPAVPTVPFDQKPFVQVRAWESAYGNSYEEARAMGGRFGRSEISQAGPPAIAGGPWRLTGLSSFRLQSGFPVFTTGLLESAGLDSEGNLLWRLRGEAGFRYLVEQALDGLAWEPLLVLTNQAGSVSFSTPDSSAGRHSLYRSRLLD